MAGGGDSSQAASRSRANQNGARPARRSALLTLTSFIVAPGPLPPACQPEQYKEDAACSRNQRPDRQCKGKQLLATPGRCVIVPEADPSRVVVVIAKGVVPIVGTPSFGK